MRDVGDGAQRTPGRVAVAMVLKQIDQALDHALVAHP